MSKIGPNLLLVSMASKYKFENSDLYNGVANLISDLSKLSIFVGIIKDTPIFDFDPPTKLARNAWAPHIFSTKIDNNSAISVDSDRLFNIQKEVSKKYQNVFTVDMNKYILGKNSLKNDDIILYRDSHHLTGSYARKLSAEIFTEIRACIFGKISSQNHNFQEKVL